MSFKMAFLALNSKEALEAQENLRQKYGRYMPDEADILVVLGGDGLLLETFHKGLWCDKPIYGMNFGSIGFLMNPYQFEDLPARIDAAQRVKLYPLKMTVTTRKGKIYKHHAINEVSLLREFHQAAKISIEVDGRVRMKKLVCDGVLVSSPAGSTAYNLSAHGPILPLDSNILALTPISAFRPRRWRGALLPHDSKISFTILEPEKRPVSAVADFIEIRDAKTIEVEEDRSLSLTLLFDEGQDLAERILTEQFMA